jgi:hypothetical protein
LPNLKDLNADFYWIGGGPCVRNYTAAGRRVRNEIGGFRQFLQGAEQDRLERMNPARSQACFDPEFIPYAIALDLREGWGDELGVKAMVETALSQSPKSPSSCGSAGRGGTRSRAITELMSCSQILKDYSLTRFSFLYKNSMFHICEP